MKLEKLATDLLGVAKILKNHTLSVPTFQRAYAWEAEHVREFFEDISGAMSRKEPEYFLGSLVLSNSSGATPELVDGQQRLATTTILIAAIRDHFISIADSGRARSLESEFLFALDRRTQDRLPRLRLNELDHEFFEKRVLSEPTSSDRKVEPTRDSHRRIAVAADEARSQVAAIVKANGKGGADAILDLVDYLEKQALVISLGVPDHANAFVIFETLNDRGLDLSISDLLKNYLFKLAGDKLNTVKANWIKMGGALEATGDESVLLTYLRHFWASTNGPARERELYSQIKKKTPNKQSAVKLADELADSAQLYAAIVNPNHVHWANYGASARKHLETLQLLRMEQFRPLLLAVLAKFDAKNVERTMALLVSWSVRFLVVGGLGGGSLERHYALKAQEVRSGAITNAAQLAKEMLSVVPTDAEFENEFKVARVSQSYLARYYLRALERAAAGEPDPELVPNDNEAEINLEHILPENPSTQWSVPADKAGAEYRRIGNMVLMKTKINSTIGNSGFDKKKPILKSSKFLLTQEAAKAKEWNISQIEKRQEKLAKLAIKAWPLKP
ncbi:DUF262 domain-containing protein [Archangium lansingense]|uniref:DUF262 domain-containing HNH endonuclease family protein n=1 Tax=Archangium lansingense TaxID=2995310 RepID=A0ABT4AA56_9BACT|nr:DUF262 domain-containing HNH endonuclease family protein [Archangium lansinium]MCY1078540.1 DUF262 domain-containing HNH endonuclease family protein [Archangium lansinium]